LDLPSLRVTPMNTCPGLRPRWCPGHLPQRMQDCCLPRHAERRLSSRFSGIILTDHNYTYCRVTKASYPAKVLPRSGLGDFHHPAPPSVRLAVTFPISGQKYRGLGADSRGVNPQNAPNLDALAGFCDRAIYTMLVRHGT